MVYCRPLSFTNLLSLLTGHPCWGFEGPALPMDIGAAPYWYVIDWPKGWPPSASLPLPTPPGIGGTWLSCTACAARHRGDSHCLAWALAGAWDGRWQARAPAGGRHGGREEEKQSVAEARSIEVGNRDRADCEYPEIPLSKISTHRSGFVYVSAPVVSTSAKSYTLSVRAVAYRCPGQQGQRRAVAT